MSKIVLLVVLLIILVLGASIGYFNAQPIHFNYLFGSAEFPLIAVLIAAFSIGILLTLLVVAGRLLTMRMELGRLRKQLREAEGELRTLRNLPVGNPPTTTP
ncbi:LapA family protein [Solimonas marina]|uniref:LapA family protein n=1 Tax=Solimonas marina TaxID=2714601 RepID=A0A969WA43_9GAMM|nr:LapA family protein [Solimonas marina]NKF22694.1 LapA family protein [Solimonas marina]